MSSQRLREAKIDLRVALGQTPASVAEVIADVHASREEVREQNYALRPLAHALRRACVNVRLGDFEKRRHRDAARPAAHQFRGQSARVAVGRLVPASVRDEQQRRVHFQRHVMEGPGGCDMLEIMIGTQLGRWVIDRQLGRGAMGAVYYAHAADAPNEVRAVKVLAPDLARDPVAQRRFKQETELLCQLDHPNIVRFDGASTEGETAYYVMEYVNGPDCETRLREIKRWPWWEVIDLTIQVTRGLKYAHDQSIVHRDLKPANILLAHDVDETEADVKDDGARHAFTAKIADFGVARVFTQGQLTGSGQFIGTALYMAPEQAAGKLATKRSDFYALGCVMYTLLTGRPPFNGTSIGELVHKHQFAQPERPSRLLPDLPHDVDELVVQLLSKDPAQRPADGSVLLKRLESIRGKLARKHNLTDTAFRSESHKASTEPWSDPTANDEAPAAFDRSKIARAALLSIALIAVVVAIGWKLTQPRVTAEELIEPARKMMKSSDPKDWERAWSEYLEPLGTRFPNHAYTAEVEQYRQQIDGATALRRLTARHPRGSPHGEAQRFFELGLQKCQVGDVEGGRKVWEQLVNAFGPVESEQAWVRLAQHGLGQVKSPGPASPDAPDFRSALAEASKLRDKGQRDKAEAIWSALEALYRNEPGAEAVLSAIRAERNKKS
jgi:serine/threonine protein kinase